MDKMNIFLPFFLNCKDVKDAKRHVDKNLERLDAAIYKLSSFPKSKEPSAIAEQTALVIECKKSYQTVCLDFVHRVNLLKSFLDSTTSEKMAFCLENILALFEESALIIKSLQTGVSSFQRHENIQSFDQLNSLHKKWRDVNIK